ncbi:MAG: aminotransferase class I/II-fold pyridoxal phosphate-dependent enzyme [Pseudomonadota bacterium]
MALTDKFTAPRDLRARLSMAEADPTAIHIEKLSSPTEAMIHGRRTILLGTNNYLGLTLDPACIREGQRALEQFGTGTTGSRMANGTYADHLALESELADFYGVPHSMVFSTGYTANLGCLSALVGPGDVVMLDADAHASLYDGCRLSGATIYRFKHNDLAGLDRRLGRLGQKAADTLIVVEGVYSILGDRAPLADLVDIARKYGALLFVDEAHSLGVYGERGRGQVEEQGVVEEVDFIVGTFSKSLATTGGFCVSRHDILPLFRYVSRPYIFTASPGPAVVASAREALRQLRTRPELREQLWANADRLYGALRTLGLSLGPDVSPIVAVRFSDRSIALGFWKGLLDRGVYTNLILPPAAPDGGSLVRCSVTAAHTQDQIETVIEAFTAMCRSEAAGIPA